MIDSMGRTKPGKPRRGYETVEWARVRADIWQMLNDEIPDPEIALRINTTPEYFYKLKKRLLSELAMEDVGRYVAAREVMRIEKQIRNVLKHLALIEASNEPPDERLMKMYVDLSKLKADYTGAYPPAQYVHTMEMGDSITGNSQKEKGLADAAELEHLISLQDRVAAAGIGSGMTREERQREIANLQTEMVELGMAGIDGQVIDAEVVDDEEELISFPGVDSEGRPLETDDSPEMLKVPRLSEKEKRRHVREHAAANVDGEDDRETPGRWLDGKFITFWHEVKGRGAELDADSPYNGIDDEPDGLAEYDYETNMFDNTVRDE